MIGVNGSATTINKDSGGTAADFNLVGGTLNANYYSVSGLGNSGLNLSSGTIISLHNGTFDNSGGKVANNSSYITTTNTVLDAGGSQVFTGITFDSGATDPNIKYNVRLVGTPASANNYWMFSPSLGNFGTGVMGEANDLDPGDGSVNNSNGYILWSALVSSIGPNIDQILRHGEWFNSGVRQPFGF